MSHSTPSGKVRVLDVLADLGFVVDPTGHSDDPPALALRGSNYSIRAGSTVTARLWPVVHFGGSIKSGDGFSIVDFALPLTVDSLNQAMAWIAYGLGRGTRLDPMPPWLPQALALSEELPWMKRPRQTPARVLRDTLSWQVRPCCLVERDWARLALNFLRRAAERDPFEVFGADFDGEMLIVRALGQALGVPATGSGPWRPGFRASLQHLHPMPRMLRSDPVEISIWDEALRMDHGSKIWVVSPRPEEAPMPGQELFPS
jgi:hypothetical protein